MDIQPPPPAYSSPIPPKRLMVQVQERLRALHYSLRTEQAYRAGLHGAD